MSQTSELHMVTISTPPTEISKGWRFIDIVIDGAPMMIGGLNIWNHRWLATGEAIIVTHPNYPSQRHSMSICEVTVDGAVVKFAAGEFSNSVWGFYIPE